MKISRALAALAALSLSGIALAEQPRVLKDEYIISYHRPSVAALLSGIEWERSLDRSNRVRRILRPRISRLFPRARKEIVAYLESDNACSELMAEDPNIDVCEPNFVVSPLELPDDPLFDCSIGEALRDCQWALQHPVGVDIDAPQAWQLTTGSTDTLVAIIDSGINYGHLDLIPNLWVNPLEIPGNGIDDDENGIIDDIHGANMIDRSGDPFDPDPESHGTHVAGIIGAVGGNGLGISGVVPNVKLIAIRFIDELGGSTADAIAAINYMTDLKLRLGHNIVVSNNSWGGGPFSASLRGAIREAGEAGILFVAAAGNNGFSNDVFPMYPASYNLPSIISVAATELDGGLASFSNFGDDTVHIGAPGSAILSTVGGSNFEDLSGTSMAAPHVSGVLALVHSLNAALPPHQLKDIVLSTGRTVPELQGLLINSAVVNAASAVSEAAGATPAPSPTPTATRTVTPTRTPTSTRTPTPTRAPNTPTPGASATPIVDVPTPEPPLLAQSFRIAVRGEKKIGARRKATVGRLFEGGRYSLAAERISFGAAANDGKELRLTAKVNSIQCEADIAVLRSTSRLALRGRMPSAPSWVRRIVFLLTDSGRLSGEAAAVVVRSESGETRKRVRAPAGLRRFCSRLASRLVLLSSS